MNEINTATKEQLQLCAMIIRNLKYKEKNDFIVDCICNRLSNEGFKYLWEKYMMVWKNGSRNEK